MKNIVVIIIIFLNIICFGCKEKDDKKDITQSVVKVQKLLLRDSPNQNAKVLAVLLIDDKIEIIEKTNHISIIDGMERNWYKIKTSQNIVGYVFSGYLKEPDDREYQMNDKPFDVTGCWAEYLDPPNQIYCFYKGGKFERKFQSEEKGEEIFTGKFLYNGNNAIRIKEDKKDEYIIRVFLHNGKTTLKYDDYFFDPELHSND